MEILPLSGLFSVLIPGRSVLEGRVVQGLGRPWLGSRYRVPRGVHRPLAFPANLAPAGKGMPGGVWGLLCLIFWLSVKLFPPDPSQEAFADSQTYGF